MSRIDSLQHVGLPRRFHPMRGIGGAGEVTYILLDRFNDNLSAGSVNGTPASPGPGGNRVVTDTENKLSVANSQLTFSGGKAVPENGDPGLWYEALSRTAGRIVMWDITLPATDKVFMIGLDLNQTKGIAGNHTLFFNSNAFAYIGNANYEYMLYTATSYQIAVVLRTTGTFYFVRGGAFSNWTLLLAWPLGNDATLYPYVQNNNSQAVVDNVRIPYDLWLPRPLASDSFAYSGTVLATSITSPLATEGAELYTDPGLEGTYTGGLSDSLTSSIGTPSQSADVHGGVKAQQFIATANGQSAYVKNAYGLPASVTIGDWYIAKQWAKRTAGAAGTALHILNQTLGLRQKNIALTAAGYTEIITSVRTNGTGPVFPYLMYQNGAGPFDTIIIDDISVKKLVNADIFSTVDYSTPNVDLTVNLTRYSATSATEFGVVLNADTSGEPGNCVFVGISNTASGMLIFIDKKVSGTWYTVGQAVIVYAAGAPIRVIKYGNHYTVYYNGVLVSTWEISDSTVVNNTRHGLLNTYVGNTFSGYSISDIRPTTLDGLGDMEQSGPSGLTWTRQSGSAAVVGNSLVVCPVETGSELIPNEDMEAGDPPNGWSQAGTPTTFQRSSTQKYRNSYSLRVVTDAISEGGSALASVTQHKWYRQSAWFYPVAGTAYTHRMVLSAQNIASTKVLGLNYWQLISNTWRSSATGANSVIWRNDDAASEFYLDTVSVKELSLPSMFATIDFGTPDVLMQVDISGWDTTGQAGLVLNLDSDTSPQNFILVYFTRIGSAANLICDECVAGVYTNKVSVATTPVNGQTLNVIRYGNKLRAYYNNIIVWGETVNYTANTNTRFGVFSTSAIHRFDNFVCRARGTSGEYDSLARY